jgi:hypothetical protein
MALLVLFSTMSFSMDMHFCGDMLVDFKLFQEADTCQMAMNMTSMDMAGEDMDMQCCSDVELLVTGQEDLQLSFDELSLEQQSFIVAFTIAYSNVFIGIDKHPIPFKEYSPPLLIRDVQLLDQTFLI